MFNVENPSFKFIHDFFVPTFFYETWHTWFEKRNEKWWNLKKMQYISRAPSQIWHFERIRVINDLLDSFFIQIRDMIKNIANRLINQISKRVLISTQMRQIDRGARIPVNWAKKIEFFVF